MGLWFGLLIVSQRRHDVHGADLAFFWGAGERVLLEENGCSLSALLCPGGYPPNPLPPWTRRPKQLFAITAVDLNCIQLVVVSVSPLPREARLYCSLYVFSSQLKHFRKWFSRPGTQSDYLHTLFQKLAHVKAQFMSYINN